MIAVGALGVMVAVAAVVLLVARDEPARAADEPPGRLPVTAAGFAVCEPEPEPESVSEPAAAPALPGDAVPERARIPMQRRRSLVPLDDRTSVVMQTDDGAYQVSVKRVNRPRNDRRRESGMAPGGVPARGVRHGSVHACRNSRPSRSAACQASTNCWLR